MPFAENENVQLYYEVHGKGFPVVFIHGLFGLVEHWREQIPVLSRKFKVVAYDLRGHGRSHKPVQDAYAISQDADDLDAILSELKISNMFLVAHSKGGGAALQYCLDHLKNVKGLVLVASFAAGSHLGGVPGGEDIFSMIKDQNKRAQLYTGVLGKKLIKRRPKIAQWALEEAWKMPVETALAVARGFATLYDIKDRVAEVKVPTLLIWGDRDERTPLDPAQKYLLDNIKGSRLEIFKGSAHYPMLDEHRRFNKILLEFLRENLVK